MRVLLVSAHGADRTYGGAERYVAGLADGLRRRGHEVVFLTAFPVHDGSATSTVSLHRVDWRESRLRRYRNHAGDWIAAPWPRLAGALRDARPDLVHTSNLPGIGTGIWEQARRLETPVVHTLHDYQLLCPRTSLTRRDGTPCRPNPLLCGLRTRRLARWAPDVSSVIGVSKHLLHRHDGFFPNTAVQRVIYHPLEPIVAASRIPPRALATLGYVGALSRSKGIELLIEAAPGLARRGIQLRIAGDGPLRAQVQAAAQIRYEGRLDPSRLAEFLASCDAGVVPSLWEEPGLTYVLCEWLSAGRPVLATKRGGLAEAAALGGVTAIKASAQSLVAVAERLLRAQEWRQLLASVPVVENAKDVDRWVDEHLAAYDAALAGPPRGAAN